MDDRSPYKVAQAALRVIARHSDLADEDAVQARIMAEIRPESAGYLSTIARTHRMKLSVLRSLNGIPPNESLIRIGQTLRVTGTGTDEPRIHIVTRGDTLLRIARAYGVKLTAILALNRLTERALIHPGQAIKIP